MTLKDYYFMLNPNSPTICDSVAAYPAGPDGGILCAKEAGYIDICYAGEGFLDCRDCWLMQK